MKRKSIVTLALIFAFVVGYFVFIKANNQNQPSDKTSSKNTGPAQKNQFDKTRYSVDDPVSLWVIVNKKRPLPAAYAPNNLVGVSSSELMRQDAANALSKLLAAARLDGINYSVISGYRSFEYQKNLYNSYVKKDGAMQADTYSARPGHSEHQTGLAADLGTGNCDLEACFGDSPAGKWLEKNAHKFGFVIRYPKDKENLTGYQYEPWHIRYFGEDLANELLSSYQTAEQFFNLPIATEY